MRGILPFLSEHAYELQQKLLQHISLTTLSVLIASWIAIPLGILIIRSSPLRRLTLKVGSISQTIPSLALLAFLVPFLGLGVFP